MSESSYPVKVSSKVRFAVLAPSDEFPVTFLQSSDDISDLRGYYALRDTGFSKFLDGQRDLDGYGTSNLDSELDLSSSLNSIDVWLMPKGEERERLYSLVFDLPDWLLLSDHDRSLISEKIQNNLRDLAQAISQQKASRVKYIGEAISALFSFVENLGSRERLKRQRRRESRQLILRLYVGFAALITLILFLYIMLERFSNILPVD